MRRIQLSWYKLSSARRRQWGTGLRPRIDPRLEADVNRLMCCAPTVCQREHSCYRVAKFARDKLREMHAIPAPDDDHDVEQYAVNQLYCNTGSWEAA